MGGSSFRPMRPNNDGGSSFSGSGAPREITSSEPCDAFLFTRSSSTSSSRNVFGSSSYDSRRHSQSNAALLVVLRAPLLAATAANARAALSSSKPAAVTPANAPARAAPASLSFAVSLVKRLAALPKGQPSSRFNTSPMASCAARDILLLYERSVSTRLIFIDAFHGFLAQTRGRAAAAWLFDRRSARAWYFYTLVAGAKMLLHLPWFQQQCGYEAKFDVSRCGHLESDRCA